MTKKRIVVGVSGASSMLYAQRLLYFLHTMNIEIHLIISKTAEHIIQSEKSTLPHHTENILDSFTQFAEKTYAENNFFASIASGSFLFDGMVLIPCSMNTLAHIANGTTTNLLHRTAGVCLKEQRKLVLVPRETPLSPIHLENMLKLSTIGAIIMPPAPALYMEPKNIEELVDIFVLRILDIFHIEHSLMQRWNDKNTSL